MLCNSAQIREEIFLLNSGAFARPLIGPVRAHANVSRLNSAFLSSARLEELLLERPFAEIDVTIPRLDVTLDQFQYQSLLRFVSEIISLTKRGTGNQGDTEMLVVDMLVD